MRIADGLWWATPIVATTILAFSTTAFAQANGTISGRSPSGPYSGKWRISGNQICFSYPEGQRAAKWDCTEVRLDGNRIRWEDNTTATLTRSPCAGQKIRPRGCRGRTRSVLPGLADECHDG